MARLKSVTFKKSLDTGHLRLPMQRMPRTMGVGRMARLESATPTRSDRQDSLDEGSTLFLTVKQDDFSSHCLIISTAL
jgi:hypothetical protein